MTEFFADPLKFYQLHPGWLFVTATLLPLLSFVLIFLASGAWALLRRYRDDHVGIEQLYHLFGGDKGGRLAAYIATAAIGLSFVLSLTGFILFNFVDGDKEQKRDAQEAKIRETRELLVLVSGLDKELEKSLHDEEAELTAIDARWAGRFDWLRIAPAITNDPQRGTALQLGFRIDSLAAIMFVMVTFIATLIHIFSIGYMSDELPETVEDHQVHGEHGHLHRRGRFGRFFMYLSLFCFSMLNLVLADNLFQVFVSWELVGLCSYLLIGFYYERRIAANAANKAFIVNRVGDAGFIIGLLILWTYVGTFNFEDLFRQIRAPVRVSSQIPWIDGGGTLLGGQVVRSTAEPSSGRIKIAGPDQPVSADTQAVLFPRDPKTELYGISGEMGVHWGVVDKGTQLLVSTNPDPEQFGVMPYWMLVLAGLGIFLGCAGKSAQFPLQVWLPDAMEGPTPVSALIHAATMVAAGVYLVGRVYPLFTPEVLLVIAYVGGITLFVAATIAVVMTDIKKVLAYSTISQLGYLMLAMGVGGWTASLFHLITHAFFKALLFLCSGAVIYNCHHEQDMTKMGGLFPKMKITALAMLAGVLAISGVPGFSGWYSKDAILAQAFGFVWVHPGHILLFLLPLVTAGITTFYMFRMWFLTFAGKPRDAHVYEHAHEAPWVMTVPLIVLAVFSVCVAWGRQPWNPEESFLAENISESQPASVIADFGRVETDPLWKGGRLKDETHSERYLAQENHALAGNLALGVVALGLVFAALLYYYRVLDSEESKEQFATLHGFLWNKWYFDELYSAIAVRPALTVAHWFKWFDLTVIDGIIHFVAFATVRVSKWDGLFDHHIIDGLVNVMGGAVSRVGNGLRGVETGSLRNYVLFLVLAAVGIFLVLTWWVAMVMAG
ncbi:MAG TPA: NADH-quinone oxidoreductase subunit L [Planctomycetales bacterium]|jgi:NADH-quinone oxidoreductase subunit L|nr:NADH-quinone oxidoreductase subunit L [Planctomycetales bacterium]